MKTLRNKQKGFTLIELLVVVSIIGILAGILLNVIDVSGTQKKARDSQRISDLSIIKVAMGLYFSDYGVYVSTSGDWQTVADALTGPVEGNYLDKLPTDPLDTQNYMYYSATGASYTLTAAVELENSASGTCTGSPHASGSCYAVSGY